MPTRASNSAARPFGAGSKTPAGELGVFSISGV